MLLKGALLLSALTSVIATPILQERANSGSSSPSSDWDAAWEKARSIVSQMTFDEKINFTEFRTVGIQGSGQTHSIDRFNISSLTFSDSPTGVNSRFSSQFPAEVTAAASWDVDLIYKRAAAMGVEFAEVGVNVPLSIVIGGMGRSILGGRNWESWTADPYLAGEAVRVTVSGMQEQGVTALVKHFYGNEQEFLRIGADNGGYFPANESQTISSNMDDATAHEQYIWPFAEAVRAGSLAVMCSYNKLNGTLGCEDDHSLNTVLKGELGFKGFVLSDWGAAKNTVQAALNGLDFVEGGAAASNIWGDLLRPQIENGTLPADIMDDKIVRVLYPYFALSQDTKLPKVDFSRTVIHKSHNELIRNISSNSITLLKNSNRTSSSSAGLPFKEEDIRSIVLVGSGAGEGRYGIISNQAQVIFDYTPAQDYVGQITNGFGSGGSPAFYTITPIEGIRSRAMKSDPPIFVDGYYSDNATEGSASTLGPTPFLDGRLGYPNSKVVVFVTATAQEGYDRETLDLANGGDELVNYVASRYNDTIVVINAPGPVNMEKWIDNENVTAVLFGYLPGQEGGAALADVLFGDVNPSGKLPFTVAKSYDEYDVEAYYDGPIVAEPQTNFTEGVFLDYKYFDQQNTTPLFEFGYGMSYTTFNFSQISAKVGSKPGRQAVSVTNEKLYKNGSDEVSSDGLYNIAATVTAVVKNSGKVAGAEVAQLYLTFPDSTPNKMPVRNLRGFSKPFLQPGESTTVSFPLRNKDLAVWDVVKQGWMIPQGKFEVSVGSSSRELPLKASFEM